MSIPWKCAPRRGELADTTSVGEKAANRTPRTDLGERVVGYLRGGTLLRKVVRIVQKSTCWEGFIGRKNEVQFDQ